MNYNSILNSNNDELENIASAVNDIPSSSTSGGGLEFCTVTIAPAYDFEATELYYSDGNSNVANNKLSVLNIYESTNIQVVKNTILVLQAGPITVDVVLTGGATLISGSAFSRPEFVIAITGDCSIFSGDGVQ